ncbi:hypothetical protein K438DRAFT_1788405 [Mycena galopus ATCC 62051]|nr:hypothetical protein K438DRAFT_1788405 [Mycena galopus ATCC 62051]
MTITKKQKAATTREQKKAKEQQARMRQSSASASDLTARNATVGDVSSQLALAMGRPPEIRLNEGGSLLDESNGYGDPLVPDINDGVRQRGSGGRAVSSPLPAMTPSAENSLVTDRHGRPVMATNQIEGTGSMSSSAIQVNSHRMVGDSGIMGATRSPFLGPESDDWRQRMTVRIEEVEDEDDMVRGRKEGTRSEGGARRSSQWTGRSRTHSPLKDRAADKRRDKLPGAQSLAGRMDPDPEKREGWKNPRMKQLADEVLQRERDARRDAVEFRRYVTESLQAQREQRRVREEEDHVFSEELAAEWRREDEAVDRWLAKQVGRDGPPQEVIVEDAAQREHIQDISLRAAAMAEHEASAQRERDAIAQLKSAIRGIARVNVTQRTTSSSGIPDQGIDWDSDGRLIEVQPAPSCGSSVGTAGGAHRAANGVLLDKTEPVQPKEGRMGSFESVGGPEAESSERKVLKQEASSGSVPARAVVPTTSHYLQPGTKPVRSAAGVPLAAAGGAGNGPPSDEEESDDSGSDRESGGSGTDSAWGDHGDDRNGSGHKSSKGNPGGGGGYPDDSGDSESESSEDRSARNKGPSKTP